MTPAQRSQAEKNQAAHRRAEAAALLLLTAAARRERSPAPAIAAHELRPAIRGAIVLGRARAREIGLERLEAESAQLGEGISLPTFPLAGELENDWRRAQRASASYADAYYAEAQSSSTGAAAEELSWRIDRIAATETTDAFNGARRSVLRQQGGGRIYARVYDASLDNRTCSACEGAHGEVAMPGETFSVGEPPVHANCRCVWYLRLLGSG